jgi:L-threonylcarbamoyladenylate synthase
MDASAWFIVRLGVGCYMLNASDSGVHETQVLDGAKPEAIGRAVSILRAGGLVAFPTETVYGLGADGLNPRAVAMIYEAKGRPSTNPLILHVADIKTARPLVADWPVAAQRLAEKYWPGPLTIVLPASGAVPEIVRAGNPTVALRSPKHTVALELLRAFGGPLAAPSANRTTETSPTKPEHVLNGMGGRIDLILDGGRTTSGVESTIVTLAESPPRLLRPGPIRPADLEAVLGGMTRFDGAVSAGDAQAAPGMSHRHYAPKARLTLHEPSELVGAFDRASQVSSEKVAAVVIGEAEPPPNCDYRRLPADAEGVSARLYALLHDLDSEGYKRILFQAPPMTDEWLTVRDRLFRASSKD